MIKVESRAIAQRRKEQETLCDCKEDMFPSTNRRGFLTGVVAALATRSAIASTPGAVNYPVAIDPSKEQGRPIGANGGYGSRSPFESEVRWRYPTATLTSSWSMTPLDKSQGIITPSGLHFERHHGGIPTSIRHDIL